MSEIEQKVTGVQPALTPGAKNDFNDKSPSVLALFNHIRKDFWKIFDRDDIVEIQYIGENEKLHAVPLRGDNFDTGLRLSGATADLFVRMMADCCGQVINHEAQLMSGVVFIDDERYRISCTIPEASRGITFLIRRYLLPEVKYATLVNDKTISAEQGVIIERLIAEKKNILVAGDTGVGKTTFLNALLDLAKDNTKRFVVVEEDAAEINIKHNNVHSMRNTSTTDIDSLIKHTLRSSPERLVIGEIRDSSLAAAFINSLSSGHNGSMATIHSASARGAFDRLSTFVSQAGMSEFDVKSNLNCVIHLTLSPNSDSGRVVGEMLAVVPDPEQSNVFNYELLCPVRV